MWMLLLLAFGLYTRWFRAEGLLLGWVIGIGWGTWTAWSNGMKPLASLALGGANYSFFVGLGALILNIVAAIVATAILRAMLPEERSATARS